MLSSAVSTITPAAAPSATVASTRALKLDPHTDGISALHFNPSSANNLLLVTSWDGGATVYNTEQNTSQRFPHAAAVLCGAFTGDNKVFTGGIDPTVRMFTPSNTMDEGKALGTHEAPVRCLNWVDNLACLLSGSWDKTAKLWDSRIGSVAEAGSVTLSDKVFAQDVYDTLAVFALADGSIQVYDLRRLDNGPLLARASTLEHQIRTVKIIDQGQGLLLGGIEGRVAVENLFALPVVHPPFQLATTAKRYAFKCHRQDDWIFPVNAIAALPHPSAVFATGGGDGTVHLWDAQLKKRLVQFSKLETSCSALAFAPSNVNVLAIAQSYAFERGELAQHAPDQVLLCEFTL